MQSELCLRGEMAPLLSGTKLLYLVVNTEGFAIHSGSSASETPWATDEILR